MTACQDASTPFSPTNTMGSIKGTVISPNGKTIACAKVSVKNTAESLYTSSDINGDFTIAAPIGDQILEITTGNGEIFKSEISVTVELEEELVLGNVDLKQVGALAYIGGDFDKIETIIIDELGFQADQVTTNTLSTADINFYDGLFLNCSFSFVDSTISKGVFDFITQGGSVYASDYASNYLLGNHTNHSVCEDSRDNTGFMSANTLCTFKEGIIENRIANIVDQDVAMFVGTTAIEIEYDLPGWEMVDNYDADFWEEIVTDVNNNPLMIRRTLPADWPVDKAFGNIYYTTFHNHHDQLVEPEIASILEYVILNL